MAKRTITATDAETATVPAGPSINRAYEILPVADLKRHPQNPRLGNVDAIAESIRHNGFYGALIVQTSTMHVLAGNHRLKAAVQEGFTELPVFLIDCDDETALRILLADNRTNDLAGYDDVALAEILKGLMDTDSMLAGTAYYEPDVEKLLADLAGLDLAPQPDAKVPRMDQKTGTQTTCPNCGHQWAT